jgi:hypothetical protein
MVVGPGEIPRSTVYSRSGFQVMVGATKEVSIVSCSREIDARILWLADGTPTLYRAQAEDHPATEPRPSPEPDLGCASHSRGFSIEEIAAPLMQLSSKAKENGDHSAQVTAGNAMAAYERQRYRSRA